MNVRVYVVGSEVWSTGWADTAGRRGQRGGKLYIFCFCHICIALKNVACPFTDTACNIRVVSPPNSQNFLLEGRPHVVQASLARSAF